MNPDHLSGTEVPETQGKHRDAVICACLQRTASEIREAAERLGLETFEDLATAFLAGAGCTTCRSDVEAILETVTDLQEDQNLDAQGTPERVDAEEVTAEERKSL